MKWLDDLDRELLWLFEKLTHGSQYLFGKDNFWLGWAAFYCEFAVFAIRNIADFLKGGSFVSFIGDILMTAGLMILLQYVIALILNTHKPQRSSGSSMSRNPLEVSYTGKMLRLLEVAFLLLWVLELYTGKASVYSLFIRVFGVARWYFFSCTPLPPGKDILDLLTGPLKALFGQKAYVPIE